MILRRAIAKHGRQIVNSRTKTWTRSLSAEADLESLQESIDNIEHSLDNSLRETKSIDSQADNSGVQYVPQIDNRAHMARELLRDGTKEAFEAHSRHRKRTQNLGTHIGPHYQPHTLLTHPPRPSDITLELLLASQAHLGHKTSHWNPANSRYIFGIRQGIHIISLDVTAAHLRRACRVVSGVAERGGIILFVGTRPGQERCIVKAAEMAEGCHLFERWTPGSITNGNQILRSCRMKVVDGYDRIIPDTEQYLAEESALKPDLVVCLNPLENWVMLHECGLNGIPTIGVIDTDANPTWVTYPIPANDDSLRCIQVIAGVLGRAGEEGQANRREATLRGAGLHGPIDLSAISDAREKLAVAADVNDEEDLEDEIGLSSGAGDSGISPAADGGPLRARDVEAQ